MIGPDTCPRRKNGDNQRPTEWVKSFVEVVKANTHIRSCLDTRNYNKFFNTEHYQLQTFEKISTRLAGATCFTKLGANKGYWQTVDTIV